MLPLLLATLCVDLVILTWDFPESADPLVAETLGALLIAQVSLLAFWTGVGERLWLVRMAVSASFICLLSYAPLLREDGLLAFYLTVFASFYAALFCLVTIRHLLVHYFRPDAKRLFQFSLGQAMAAMTVVCLAAAASRFGKMLPELSAIRLAVLLAPYAIIALLVEWLARVIPRRVIVLLVSILLGALVGYGVSRALPKNSAVQLVVHNAVLAGFCALWFVAVRVEPDARRRLAVRRRRRTPRLRVVEAPTSRQPLADESPPSGFDVKA